MRSLELSALHGTVRGSQHVRAGDPERERYKGGGTTRRRSGGNGSSQQRALEFGEGSLLRAASGQHAREVRTSA